jgi:bifunctional non-homologous end joining protein LigD
MAVPKQREKLDAYRAKRSFDVTSEPTGGGDGDAGGGRFVIQEHHARRLHWDFRLERDGVLVSWALPRGVPADPDRNRLAVHTEDHPLEYLDFTATSRRASTAAARWRSGIAGRIRPRSGRTRR